MNISVNYTGDEMECTIGKSADDAKSGECQQAGEIGWQGPCVIQQGEVRSSAPGEEPAQAQIHTGDCPARK